MEAEKHKRGDGAGWSEEQVANFKRAMSDRFDTEASPWFGSARLWDDGVIDPADTRRVVGMALTAAMHGHVTRQQRVVGTGRVGTTHYGVFRM